MTLVAFLESRIVRMRTGFPVGQIEAEFDNEACSNAGEGVSLGAVGLAAIPRGSQSASRTRAGTDFDVLGRNGELLMAFCANCGASVPDGAGFCSGCGKPVAASGTVSGASGQAAAPAPAVAAGMTSNVAGALAYILGFITGIIFLLLDQYKNDRFVRFHAMQSIFYSVACIAFSIAWGIVWGILFATSTSLGLLLVPIRAVISLAMFGYWLTSCIRPTAPASTGSRSWAI